MKLLIMQFYSTPPISFPIGEHILLSILVLNMPSLCSPNVKDHVSHLQKTTEKNCNFASFNLNVFRQQTRRQEIGGLNGNMHYPKLLCS
jgi:hypothetical protein